MAKKGTNDQDHIIEAIEAGDRKYTWEQVKFVGTMSIESIDERFMIFNKAFDNFDPERNNNFILFYKRYLNYNKINKDDSSFSPLTDNRSVINTLKSEASTPTDNNQKLIEDLKLFTSLEDY